MENGDMDVDMDIDLGPIDGGAPQAPDQGNPSNIQLASNSFDICDVSAVTTEHETPQKVHIRGVDDLTTEDIKAFSAEHFPSESPLRIEWIDDTSANIVYDTAAAASMALTYFSLSPKYDMPYSPIQLRSAKVFSSHPESNLYVRIALLTDQKRPRAYEASRFYMMHPEYDPREQRRRDRSSRSGHGDYQRRGYGREEQRRRKEGDQDGGFKTTMHEDDSKALAYRGDGLSDRRASKSTRSSFSSADDRKTFQERRTRARRRIDAYRPGRSNGNDRGARDRSASPDQDDGAHLGRSDRRNSRRRTPPPPYQARDPHLPFFDNSGKELFPSKPRLGPVRYKDESNIFFKESSVGNLKKELFPNKSTNSNHRRTDAFDAADETADLFATGLNVSPADAVSTSRRNLTEKLANHTLSYGRLKSPDPEPELMALEVLNDGGLNIRGASRLQDSGFSIRGAADDASCVPQVNELFPERVVGNVGKELFADKLQGRGGKRNKAEDMFN